MDASSMAQWAAAYQAQLLADTIPFWLRHGWDRTLGGIFTALDRDGSLVDSDKSVWMQGRFGWMMGELYNNVEQRDEWLAAATSACQFLIDHGFDPADGRMWFQVTREGRPLRKRRYAYSEAFAAIAFGELAQALSSPQWASLAESCLRQFIDHNTLPGRMPPKFTNVRPGKSIGVPMIAIVSCQELRGSINLAWATDTIDHAIDEIRRDFVKPDLQCVMELVTPAGDVMDHFDGRTLNPGHAIEAAWFIMREGQLRERNDYVELGLQMLSWMWQRGWDDEYGGLFHFRDVRNLPVQEYWHDMKFWWPHCEALIATLLAFQLTGDEQWLAKHGLLRKWCLQHFADPDHGEWYGYLHRDGRLSVPLKGSMWKGPFHVPRMQYQCWRITSSMVAE